MYKYIKSNKVLAAKDPKPARKIAKKMYGEIQTIRELWKQFPGLVKADFGEGNYANKIIDRSNKKLAEAMNEFVNLFQNNLD